MRKLHDDIVAVLQAQRAKLLRLSDLEPKQRSEFNSAVKNFKGTDAPVYSATLEEV